MEMVIATRNRDKFAQLQSLLDGLPIRLISLSDLGDISDIVEDGASFGENAGKKARAVAGASLSWALADDSGLVVEALGGRPGIYSARFAGKQGDYVANNAKLIEEMEGVPNGKRGASFVCAMVLAAPDGREWTAEGRCDGVILSEPRGSHGFGYDPLFFIPEEGMTMAQLPGGRKNEISHRGRALKAMKGILEKLSSEG